MPNLQLKKKTQLGVPNMKGSLTQEGSLCKGGVGGLLPGVVLSQSDLSEPISVPGSDEFGADGTVVAACEPGRISGTVALPVSIPTSCCASTSVS